MGWKKSESGYESSWGSISYDPTYEIEVKAETERLSAFVGKRFSNKAGEEFICSKVVPMLEYPITAVVGNGKERDFREEEIIWN
jgi:hypothetical protein